MWTHILLAISLVSLNQEPFQKRTTADIRFLMRGLFVSSILSDYAPSDVSSFVEELLYYSVALFSLFIDLLVCETTRSAIRSVDCKTTFLSYHLLYSIAWGLHIATFYILPLEYLALLILTDTREGRTLVKLVFHLGVSYLELFMERLGLKAVAEPEDLQPPKALRPSLMMLNR